MEQPSSPIVDLRRSMGLWARTTARMPLFCNCEVVIDDWSRHEPNKLHAPVPPLQKTTIITRQSAIRR
jgi:hypothetical protein